MKKTLLGFCISIIPFLSVEHVAAQEMGFYRVVSTQDIHNLTLESNGDLSWSNSVHNAVCNVEWASSLQNEWQIVSTNVPMTNGISKIKPPQTKDIIVATGTVILNQSTEGAYYAIRVGIGPRSTLYHPLGGAHWSSSQQIPGTIVHFTARKRNDVMNFYMDGVPFIEILYLTTL